MLSYYFPIFRIEPFIVYATQPISACVFLSVEMNKRNYKREESLTQMAARLEIGIYNCVPLWLLY